MRMKNEVWPNVINFYIPVIFLWLNKLYIVIERNKPVRLFLNCLLHTKVSPIPTRMILYKGTMNSMDVFSNSLFTQKCDHFSIILIAKAINSPVLMQCHLCGHDIQPYKLKRNDY